ncbi:hypothetical protein DJ017_17320 [Phenylobacterium soli]|uniref:Uncharacterized protein n=1 Tax=Phenylobacterium soli TaxID=2170551 RepID=A0A328ABK2_9CAUL|nr:hypothetical protein DJ017_17320 [Phenylobacterium soli]
MRNWLGADPRIGSVETPAAVETPEALMIARQSWSAVTMKARVVAARETVDAVVVVVVTSAGQVTSPAAFGESENSKTVMFAMDE